MPLLSSLVVLVWALVGGIAPATAQSAPVTPAAAEVEFLRLLNAERIAAGLAPVTRDSGLDAVARDWSATMDRLDRLHHRPDLGPATEAVEPAWQRAGENVGVGGTVLGLHRAFMDSAGHRANVLGGFNRLGVGVVVDGPTIWVTFNFLQGPAVAGPTGLEPATPTGSAAATAPVGDFWLAAADGDVRAFGAARTVGSMAGRALQRPVVGMAATPSGEGYWLVASDGGIFAFGDASFHGSTGGMWLNAPITGMAPTSTGQGYWLVASDGGIFAFGDARFHGSTGGMWLNAPITGMAPTPTGQGYWLVASDGGIFAFGDARFHGSTGGRPTTAPIGGMAATPSGEGYWLVGTDGTVHAFGDARSFGSATAAGAPLTRIAPLPGGVGYRMAAADGRVFTFDAAGSSVSAPLDLRAPVVAIANRP